MYKMKKLEKTTWMNSSLLLPGCMFMGMGIGMLFDATQIGLFIGMGVGFVSIGLIKILSNLESNSNQ
jgi:hypothetical protein